MTHNLFNTRQTFKTGTVRKAYFIRCRNSKRRASARYRGCPISIRIVLESVLRNFDGGKKVGEEHVKALACVGGRRPNAIEEIPFVVARVILQDFTGVPLLVDLAAMRSAVKRMGKDVGVIEPLVPVDLVIDHSVQVDFAGSETAYRAEHGDGISRETSSVTDF